MRGTPGVGCGHKYTAWQLAGFAVVAGCLRSSRFAGHNIGHHGVARAMEGLAERDDALLMPPEVQDPYVHQAPSSDRVCGNLHGGPAAGGTREPRPSRPCHPRKGGGSAWCSPAACRSG